MNVFHLFFAPAVEGGATDVLVTGGAFAFRFLPCPPDSMREFKTNLLSSVNTGEERASKLSMTSSCFRKSAEGHFSSTRVSAAAISVLLILKIS